MRWLLLVLALAIGTAYSQQPNPKRSSPQSSSKADQRGTDKMPLVIEITPSEEAKKQATEETAERKQKLDLDRNLVKFTQDLRNLTGVLAAIGFLQLIVFGYQALKLRQTVEAADKQSIDTKAMIAESARAASAMEKVAVSLDKSAASAATSVETSKEIAERQRIFGAMQLRAYLTVHIGGAVYQEREKPLRFEAKPKIINVGNTPAHKVSFKTGAAILSVPIPQDFTFPLPEEWTLAGVIGSRQDFDLSCLVSDFVPDADVDDIRHGKGKEMLHAWGLIKYEDAFGELHETKFFHALTWVGPKESERVIGYLLARHNEAT